MNVARKAAQSMAKVPKLDHGWAFNFFEQPIRDMRSTHKMPSDLQMFHGTQCPGWVLPAYAADMQATHLLIRQDLPVPVSPKDMTLTLSMRLLDSLRLTAALAALIALVKDTAGHHHQELHV
jgi:hypothetical protein